MIQYFEADQREPNLETINKLCKLFDCTSDYLLGLSDDSWPILGDADSFLEKVKGIAERDNDPEFYKKMVEFVEKTRGPH